MLERLRYARMEARATDRKPESYATRRLESYPRSLALLLAPCSLPRHRPRK